MDQQYVNMLLSAVCVILGWFAREMWAAVKELKLDLAHLREELPKTYLAKEDWREDIKEIKTQLSVITGMLNGKADK